LPFFSAGIFEELRNKIGNVVYAEKFSKSAVRPLTEGDIIIPGTPSYNSIVLDRNGKIGYTQDSPLRDEDVVSLEELAYVNVYNKWLDGIAKQNNCPIVDLHKLYSEINAGSYYTSDGVLIDPTYPGGNFYSSDSIYPTPLGQALIANEVIKVLNDHYGLPIPSISLSDFLNK
jgi:hypothetical protein